MAIPSHGGDDGGGENAGGGYLRRPLSEHSHTIYHNKTHYGTIYCGGAAPRGTGLEKVVGIGGTRYDRDTVCSVGAGSGEGGR